MVNYLIHKQFSLQNYQEGTSWPSLTFIVGTLHSFRAANSGTKLSVLVLFGYAQMALNTDATFEFRPHECDTGLLVTIYCGVLETIDQDQFAKQNIFAKQVSP